MWGKLIFALLSFILATGATARAADIPVAVLVDIEGDIGGTYDIFDEVLLGTEISLAADAVLTFVHYKTCREVSVRGGTIRFGARRVRIAGGEALSDDPTACPEQVVFADEATTTGATLLRDALILPTTPRFLLSGPNAGAVTGISVLLDGQEIAKLPATGRSIEWPDTQAPLIVGSEYTLQLNLGDRVVVRSGVQISNEAEGDFAVLRP